MRYRSLVALLLFACLTSSGCAGRTTAPATTPAVAVAPAAPTPGRGASLPSGAEVLDRYIEVTGGKASYDKIRTRHATGKLTFSGMGIEGPLSMWQSRPDRLRLEVDLQGLGRTESGSDGEVVWENNFMTGPRVLTGVERAIVMRTSSLHAESNWRDYYNEANCVGSGSVDDRPTYEVVLTPVEGKPVTFHFDQETGLIAKMSMIVESPMGEIPTETFPGDYREVDGILVPFRTKSKVLTMNQIIQFDSVEHNGEIPDERFALPDEIRALTGEP